MAEDQDKTNKAILDQLVYIDNFIGEDNELNFDLSAFADDSFIFADEDKPNNDKIDEIIKQDSKSLKDLDGLELNNLPRFPVPPGAKNSLQQAGLNQNQIDLLSALIAQYQSVQDTSKQGESSMYDGIGYDVGTSKQFDVEEGSSAGVGSGAGSGVRAGTGVSALNTAANKDSFGLDLSVEPTQMYFNHTNGNHTGAGASLSTSSTPSSTTTFNGNYASSNSSDPKNDNELDKRRRNTAASARFRIKKKMKEKQMEDKINNLQEVIKSFENKIQTLELENKLLKNLIIDKGSEKSDQELKMFKESILSRDRQENL